jgi:hypothetical protein
LWFLSSNHPNPDTIVANEATIPRISSPMAHSGIA